MRHFELLFPSLYLKGVDLKDRDVTLTIAEVELATLQLKGTSQTKRRGVITMAETRRDGTPTKVVLNRTNAEVIVKLYGDDVDKWIGKRITLYQATVPFGRDMVPAIRVRPQKPNGKSQSRTKAPAQEPPPDAGDAYEGADDATGTEA